ncbi:MAG: hypothetical protein H8E25_17675 [Planctomycetes bacterium]|nr:hypothetical protein [Planctomycetota bacterium]
MNKYIPLLLLSLVVFTPSCAVAFGSPVTGGLFTSVTVPGNSFETADDLAGDLSTVVHGDSSVTSFLGLFAFGDSSIMAAAANGGIRKIHHVDYEVFNFLGIIACQKTIVYGEK